MNTPTQRRLKLVLAYDGSAFHGWQRQAGVRTVQEVLEDTLRHLLRHPVTTLGASRTDTGVHARGQVATVDTAAPIPLENMRRALAHRLPADIALLHVCEVPKSFHPSGNALGKLYRYRIYNAQDHPTTAPGGGFVWHVWYSLSVERLRAAARFMVGAHDFAGFASQGSPRSSTVRTVSHVHVGRRAAEVRIDVEGDGFLYHQVRNMVGTLVEIGRGHWPPERVQAIIASRDRRLAGPTAPPQGLCLQWVRYGRLPDGPA